VKAHQVMDPFDLTKSGFDTGKGIHTHGADFY
jgi:hypothetical protein